MKKYVLFFVVLAFQTIVLYGQEGGLPNPAAAYADRMGYTFQSRIDAHGNQYTVIILPDGTAVDAWAFLTGKVGQQYSYCARHGYNTVSESVDHGGWTEQRAVCVKKGTGGATEAIPMTELMEKNGEPLVDLSDRPVVDNEEEEETPPAPQPMLKSGQSLLPGHFDWSNTIFLDNPGQAYIGPVRDQLNCGACYAFSACANAEGVYNYANGLTGSNCIDLSESFIMWCLGQLPQWHKHFYGCKGADYSYSELQAQITDGTILESYFPYTDKNPGKCTHFNDPRISFTQWSRIPCSDTEAIKQAIYTYGVVDVAVNVTTAFSNYTNGIYSDNNTTCSQNKCTETPVNHGAGLVGWGGNTGARYFILRNSWGSNWGQLGGYMLIDMFSARVACEGAYLIYAPTKSIVDKEPIGINETNAGFSGGRLLIYPNPSTGIVNLDYTAPDPGTLHVVVYSISGREVLSQDFSSSAGLNQYTLNLGGQQHGMYFISIRDASGTTFRKVSLN